MGWMSTFSVVDPLSCLFLLWVKGFLSVSLRASEAKGLGPTQLLRAPEMALPIFCRPHCPCLSKVP